MATDKRQFTLRLPDEVLEKIKLVALKNKRSASVMIEIILENYISENYPELLEESEEDTP